jgi:hypothetical protein
MIAAVRRTVHGGLALVPVVQRRPRRALGQAQETPTITPAEAWTKLNADCLEMLKSESACRGLLGTQAIYFPVEERPKVPSWAYLLIGSALGFAVANLVGDEV